MKLIKLIVLGMGLLCLNGINAQNLEKLFFTNNEFVNLACVSVNEDELTPLLSNSIVGYANNLVHTEDENGEQGNWRPKYVFHYIQYYHVTPNFIVDVTPFQEKKNDWNRQCAT